MEDAGRSWLKPIFTTWWWWWGWWWWWWRPNCTSLCKLALKRLRKTRKHSPITCSVWDDFAKGDLRPKNVQQQHKQCQNLKFYSKKYPKGHFLRAVPQKLLIFKGIDMYMIPMSFLKPLVGEILDLGPPQRGEIRHNRYNRRWWKCLALLWLIRRSVR